jgi:hypothetical protein
VRFTRLRRISLILTVAVLLFAVAWIAGPSTGISIPTPLFVAVAVGAIAVNIGLTLWTVRRMREDSLRVVAAHPDAVAFPSGIASWPSTDRAERESIVAVAADARGLSFRDHDDREVLLVPSDRIMSLELAPLVPRSRFRPFRVTTIDGDTIDFTGPPGPDAQVDAVVALRSALGRSGA